MAQGKPSGAGRIHVKCESCGKGYSVPADSIGRVAKCVCGQTFTIRVGAGSDAETAVESAGNAPQENGRLKIARYVQRIGIGPWLVGICVVCTLALCWARLRPVRVIGVSTAEVIQSEIKGGHSGYDVGLRPKAGRDTLLIVRAEIPLWRFRLSASQLLRKPQFSLWPQWMQIPETRAILEEELPPSVFAELDTLSPQTQRIWRDLGEAVRMLADPSQKILRDPDGSYSPKTGVLKRFLLQVRTFRAILLRYFMPVYPEYLQVTTRDGEVYTCTCVRYFEGAELFRGNDPGLVVAKAPLDWPPYHLANGQTGFGDVGPDIARGVINAEYVFVVPRSAHVNGLRLLGKHRVRLNAKLPVSGLPAYKTPRDTPKLIESLCWQKFPYFRDEETDLSILGHFLSPSPLTGGAKLRIVKVTREKSLVVKNKDHQLTSIVAPDGYEFAEILCGVDYSLIDVNEERTEPLRESIPAQDYAKVVEEAFHFLGANEATLTDARGRSFTADRMTVETDPDQPGRGIFRPCDYLICKLVKDSDATGHFRFFAAGYSSIRLDGGMIDVRQARLPPLWLLYVFTVPKGSELKDIQLYGQVVPVP
jgi:hypothetical protein